MVKGCDYFLDVSYVIVHIVGYDVYVGEADEASLSAIIREYNIHRLLEAGRSVG